MPNCCSGLLNMYYLAEKEVSLYKQVIITSTYQNVMKHKNLPACICVRNVCVCLCLRSRIHDVKTCASFAALPMHLEYFNSRERWNQVSKGSKIGNRHNQVGYQWDSDKLTVRHHKREPRGQQTFFFIILGDRELTSLFKGNKGTGAHCSAS